MPEASRNLPRSIIPVAAALAAAAAGTLVAATSPSINVMLLGGLILVLIAPIAVRAAQGRFDPFEPPVLFSLAFGVMFVLRPLSAVISGKYGYPIGFGQSIDFEPGLTEVLVAALVGAVAFLIGYYVPLGERLSRLLPAPPTEFDPNLATFIALGFTAIGVLSFVAFIVAGGGASALSTFLSGRSAELTQIQASANKYLIFGQFLLLPASLILLTVWHRYRNPFSLVAGSGTGLALLLIALPTGSRSLLFPLVICAAIYYYMARGARPRTGTLIVAGLIALFLSSMILLTRGATAEGPIGSGEAITRLVEDPRRVLDPLVSEADAAEADGFAAALSVPRGLLRVERGEGVVRDLVVRPIPRSLWPEKPVPPRQNVTEALFGPIAGTLVVNPEFSMLLYPYLDAGLIGVALLMLVFGAFMRTLFAYTVRHQASTAAVLIFALLLPTLMGGLRDSPVDTFARAVFLVMPVIVVFGIARIRSSPAQA